MNFDQICAIGSGGKLCFVVSCQGFEHDLDVLCSRDAGIGDVTRCRPELQVSHAIVLEILDDRARGVSYALAIIDEVVDVVVEDLEK